MGIGQWDLKRGKGEAVRCCFPLIAYVPPLPPKRPDKVVAPAYDWEKK